MPNFLTPMIGMFLVSVAMVSLFEHTENGLIKGNVMVTGEVVRPGKIPWSEHLRLWEALRRAKGFSPEADRDRISVMHLDDGVRRRLWIEQNLELAPGDTITVGTLPRTPFTFRTGSRIYLRIFHATPEETAEYSAFYHVEPDGSIHFPGVGHPIVAVDLTVSELSDSLRHAFKEVGKDFIFWLPEPHESPGGMVVVGGAVANPQEIPWQPGMRLTEVLGTAGGVTIYGKLKGVKLVRGESVRELDVSNRASLFDIEIEPNDQIIVPGY